MPFKEFIREKSNLAVAKIIEDLGRVIAVLSKKPYSIHAIVCATGLHKRTVGRYLTLIEAAQAAPKLKKEIRGARVVFRMQ